MEPDVLGDHLEDILTLDGIDFTVHDTSPVDERQLLEAARDADVIVVDPSTSYRSHVLRQLPELRAIVTTSVDVWHIDLAYCKANNVRIVNFPGFNARGAAEAAVAYGALLFRGLPVVVGGHVVDGPGTKVTSRELAGRTLGVVGAGHVGAEIVGMGKMHGMEVLCHTRRSTHDRARKLGLRDFVSLRELLVQSDIVIAAIGGDNDAANAIPPELLRKMRPDAVFVNIGQWNVADMHTLADMKHRGRLAGAAIDCNSPGPPVELLDDILIKEFVRTPRVFLIPDLGSITEDARASLAERLRNALDELRRREDHVAFRG
jgi:D-3-phosphoglycerate dehydrogenase